MIEPIFRRSAGLDVHKKMVMGTLLIEQSDGQIQEETRQFGTMPRDLLQLASWLKEAQIELTVMESTGIYWKPIYAALEEHGLKVFVVNARHVKQVPGRKTDVKDSQWLASLARFGLLKGSFIPEKDLRELRVVTRYRSKLVGRLASEKNRLHKVLDDGGIRLGNVVTDIHGVSAEAIITGLLQGESIEKLLEKVKGRLQKKIPELREALSGTLSARHRLILSCIQTQVQFLETEVKKLDDYIFAAMQPYELQWRILQTIPGMDAISAAMTIVEVGVNMQRFGSHEQFCSWAGVCPGNNESAGKKKRTKTCKGNHQLRVVLCQVANAAVKTKSQFQGKYKSLLIRKGHKKAVVAIGHKLLRVIYTLLKNGKAYQDPTVDYEALMAAKNAPRWIKTLNKFGYLQVA